MNKTISTKTGLITGILIIAFQLIMFSIKLDKSPLIALQFFIEFLGLVASCFFLQKLYASISFIDYLKHCIKTLATILFIVIVSTAVIFYFFNRQNFIFANFTLGIMQTIFGFSVSGILSAFFTSFIFNTFTKNK